MSWWGLADHYGDKGGAFGTRFHMIHCPFSPFPPSFSPPPSSENIEKYYTVDNYQAEEEDEISFQKGITLDVLQKSLDGWWVVKIDKIVGLAPATFLKKVELLDSDQAQVCMMVLGTNYCLQDSLCCKYSTTPVLHSQPFLFLLDQSTLQLRGTYRYL